VIAFPSAGSSGLSSTTQHSGCSRPFCEPVPTGEMFVPEATDAFRAGLPGHEGFLPTADTQSRHPSALLPHWGFFQRWKTGNRVVARPGRALAPPSAATGAVRPRQRVAAGSELLEETGTAAARHAACARTRRPGLSSASLNQQVKTGEFLLRWVLLRCLRPWHAGCFAFLFFFLRCSGAKIS